MKTDECYVLSFLSWGFRKHDAPPDGAVEAFVTCACRSPVTVFIPREHFPQLQHLVGYKTKAVQCDRCCERKVIKRDFPNPVPGVIKFDVT